MKKLFEFILIGATAVVLSTCSEPKNVIWLDELDLSLMTCGRGVPKAKQSIQGTPMSISGKNFERGVGTMSVSLYLVNLQGKGRSFSAKVGLDVTAGNNGSVAFYVLGDKKILWESGIMKKSDTAKIVSVKIKGIRKLGLLVTDAGDGNNGDRADWAQALIEYSGKLPVAMPANKVPEPEVILTPAPPKEPGINGPKIYGVRPGSPFLYRMPVTGDRPVTFEVAGLPSGLKVDQNTGIITGKIAKAGIYKTTLIAKNSKGESIRPFTIQCGNQLALTPPMGWNSWYIHYARVSDTIIRQSADVMIRTGMADYGYQYINIDDCWMVKKDSDDPIIGGPTRDKQGNILPNKKFPDMKAMTDYIHAKGLKAGIYTGPGPMTCARYEGSYRHERQDAQTFAAWGFDFLKHDWCSYRNIAKGTTLDDYRAPYQLMWDELRKLDRDIVFNLCQYGMAEVWKWGAQVGHCWRTTGDLGLEQETGMPGFFNIGMSNAQHWEYAHPGAWNDPDYILIGWVGAAGVQGFGKKTDLTSNEQYSYMSMWSLMAAPLIFSGDMAKLDSFTLNVLCNHEVIDINQDILGRQAKIHKYGDEELVLVKELEDGSKAIGLFNITAKIENVADYFAWDPVRESKKMSINPSEIGIKGKFKVRDVWRQKDLGIFENSYETDVPYHGAVFLKISQD